jgi:hypothetical protein
MDRLRSLAFKVHGEPPPKGSPRSQMLRWIRGFYLKLLPFMIIVWVMLLVWASQTWIFIVLAASALIWLQSVGSLSVRIRREQRRERGEIRAS